MARLPTTNLDLEELHVGKSTCSEPASGNGAVNGAHPGLGERRLEQDVEVRALAHGDGWAGGSLRGTWSSGEDGGLQGLYHNWWRGAVYGHGCELAAAEILPPELVHVAASAVGEDAAAEKSIP